MSRPDITPACRSFGKFSHIPEAKPFTPIPNQVHLGGGLTVFDRSAIGSVDKKLLDAKRDSWAQRDNIVTNRPPAFTADAIAAWVQAREEAAMERLLGGAV